MYLYLNKETKDFYLNNKNGLIPKDKTPTHSFK